MCVATDWCKYLRSSRSLSFWRFPRMLCLSIATRHSVPMHWFTQSTLIRWRTNDIPFRFVFFVYFFFFFFVSAVFRQSQFTTQSVDAENHVSKAEIFRNSWNGRQTKFSRFFYCGIDSMHWARYGECMFMVLELICVYRVYWFSVCIHHRRLHSAWHWNHTRSVNEWDIFN